MTDRDAAPPAPAAPQPPADPAAVRAYINDRLRTHRVIGALPEPEIRWLVDHGRLRQVEVGGLLATTGNPIEEMYIILSGHVAMFIDRTGGPRKVSEWRDGDVTGNLPYSRMRSSLGNARVMEATELVGIHEDLFPELTRECPVLTARLVQLMLDRARYFRDYDLHEEKMVSLGRLAAGLAHELDNPAAAVIRSADLLVSLVAEADAAARQVGAAGLTEAEFAAIRGVRDSCVKPPTQQVRSPLQQARHEEALLEWLEDRGIELENEDALADSPITVELLDGVAARLAPDRLGAAIRWIVAECAVAAVAEELRHAASRISELVRAVKGFTQVDAAGVPHPVDIEQGLNQTLTVLRAKAREKSVSVTISAQPGLPQVQALGGELNQVWANLIENALDAVAPGGSVEVTAAREDDSLVVRVVDDGPGIPRDIQERIFDPFFTTKPVGKGTGLGLDIVRRLVARHNGSVEVNSRPGRTEFRVTLPIEGIPPAGGEG